MKKDLIILHGALGCKEQFVNWSNLLSENFNCYLPDFLGHGSRSSEDVEFSIELFAGELKDLIKSKELKQPHVLGYSMGGYVALYASLLNKDLLGNIMTLATKFDWNAETSRKEAGYLIPEIMQQKVPQLAEQLKQRHGANWESVVKRTADMMIVLGEKPLLSPQNISSLQNKIKFCLGEKDKMVSVAETEKMFGGAKGGAFKILPGTGHLPETMDAKLIVSEVEDFLLTSAKN